jgi:heptosyltransferase-1
MGDVIHNLPVVTDIRRHWPDAQIDWVVEQPFADIPRLHPGVAAVLPVAVRRWRRALIARETWHEMAAFRRTLRAESYDFVVDTQGLVKSAAIAALAYGQTHGMDWSSAREPLAALFYDRRYPVVKGRHAVWRNRALAALALGYSIPSDPPDYGLPVTPSAHAAPPLPADYAVCLHATSRDSKLWPAGHWIALAARLAQAGIAAVLPWGNARERDRAQALAREAATAIVLPALSLAALADVLRGARAVVGVDTGLVHLAAALERPTIAIYTDTDPALTGVVAHDARLVRSLGDQGVIPSVDEACAALADISANVC